MNIYFGDFVTTISTLMVCLATGYIIYTAIKHKETEHWGRRIAFLALFGLLICCFVATRDNYHLSVQGAIDGTVSAGVFALNSIQSKLCCIGGAVISITCISSIFIKNEKYRKIMFFVLSTVVILKTLIIEISRWWI